MVTAPALAQDGTESPSEDATAEATEAPEAEVETESDDDGDGQDRVRAFPLFGFHGLGHGEEFLEDLAAELGVSVEDLEAAIDAVRDRQFDEHLAEAVEAGVLTQEQADEIREARENGEPFFRDFRRPGKGRFSFRFGDGSVELEIEEGPGSDAADESGSTT